MDENCFHFLFFLFLFFSCKRNPQTWSSMFVANGVSASDTWGPQNYQSCLDEPSNDSEELSSKSTEYQILSSVNQNAIGFSGTAEDGLFLFEVIVVDPEFSYCDLRVRFSVELYGAPLPFIYSFLIFIGLVAILLLALAISFRFHQKHFKQIQEAQQRKQLLQHGADLAKLTEVDEDELTGLTADSGPSSRSTASPRPQYTMEEVFDDENTNIVTPDGNTKKPFANKRPLKMSSLGRR
eukprot:TRINITY_DN155216_c0_g1_i5.p1 TRINITY_DN155216_c0_g1~~TRINITY_DN155216_c0_g1_i5.p1  ORF type:complete len:238 (-),score=50.90 TRINITY_DN155216_c0_g1_i5:255-968(-)